MTDCSKISFITKAEADDRIAEVNKKNAEIGEKLLTHSYLCNYCGMWHMTSQPRGSTNQEKWNKRNKQYRKERKRRDKFYRAKHTVKRTVHKARKKTRSKRRFTLRDKNGLVQMNPQKLVWSLTSGFVKMFGEQYRELFEEHQFDMVEIGKKAGYQAYWNKALNRQMGMFNIMLEHNKEGKATKEDAYRELRKVLSRDDIDALVKEEELRDSPHFFYDKVKEYDEIFTKEFIVNGKPPEGFDMNTPDDWDIFKEVEPQTLGLSMYGEFGLNLDDWNPKNLKYYLSENEWFYFPEGIARKYYFVGAMLGLQQRKEDYINDLIQHLKPDAPDFATATAASILRTLASDWECTTLMRRVRSEYKKRRGTQISDDFLSHAEISASLDGIDPSVLPENLFDEKEGDV